jgi:hypothetical protein
VSFDAGDHWQPLQMNLPHSSMRDLTIHGDDLIVGTHGRSFWILDDITPLREMNTQVATVDTHLFAPQTALRVHWNRNPDTPLPPETPAGQNPPDGAIIDYYLGKNSDAPITLEILDAAGKLVRKYSSADKPEPLEKIAGKHPIPMYWVREEKVLSGEAGMHRFVWDVRYAPPKSLGHGFPISAIPHDTPMEPQGPWALPGHYTVRLTVGATAQSKPLTLKMDPRIKTPLADLERQFALQRSSAEGMNESFGALAELKAARDQIAQAEQKSTSADTKHKLADFDKKAAALEGAALPGFSGVPVSGKQPENLSTLQQHLSALLTIAGAADLAPTPTTLRVSVEVESALKERLASWRELKRADLPALNAVLANEKLTSIDPERRKGDEPSSDVDGDDEP